VLTIGEFSRITHLSVRTLRRYHEADLLLPAAVDQSTGYRHYAVEQIPSAQVIHRLRQLDVPLSEIHDILLSPDPSTRAAIVAEHVGRLESELERKRAAVVALRRLLSPQPAPVDVALRAVPPMKVAAVADQVALESVLSWYAGAAAELEASVVEPSGPPGGMYDDELFQNGHGHVVVYLPTPRPPRTGRVQPLTLPAAELAVATHHGPHDDIDVTYGELGTWVLDNALSVTGPVRETYLIGPRDTDDPSAWRTEIAWPVFGLAPPAACRT
jgi:DNA-binding transcriptional MerR regulator